MRIHRLASTLATVLLLAASSCSSPEESDVNKSVSQSSYRNTFDFVWSNALDELRINFKIEKEDRAKRTITTGWNTIMSPFSQVGRRDRLTVTIVGDAQSGWKAEARQKSETNANEENPLDEKTAKWEEIPNDGGMAARFLQNLDLRLQPDERWREQLVR